MDLFRFTGVLLLFIFYFTPSVVAQEQLQPKEIPQDIIARLGSVRANEHPRLHFTSKNIQDLRRQARTNHKYQWQNLLQTVRNNASWEPMTDLTDEWLSHGSREVYLEEAGAMLTNVALAYVIEEDPGYLELAKHWMKIMVSIPQERLDNYGFGFYLMGLARAYDWLYPYLSEEERDMIRTGVLKITRMMDRLLYPEDGKPRTWWGDNYLHHDAWIPFAGYGVGALVLLGEVDEAVQWAVRSRQNFDIAFQLLGNDGAWHEGPADWSYAMSALLMYFEPWKNITGEDVFSIPWIKNTGWYRMYAWLPDDSYIYVNDSFRSGRYNITGSASSHIIRKLAAEYKNGYFQWLGERDEQFDLKDGLKGVKQSPYSWRHVAIEYPYPQIMCAAWNLLWYDPAVKPQSPIDLPLDRHFENQGIIFMRSSWVDSGASVSSFSCGPRGGHIYAKAIQDNKRLSGGNISHAHAQYNAFTLYSDGFYFIVPPGYGLRDARFQNTVLVCGEGLQYGGEIDPEIIKFDSKPEYVYIVGDATKAYYKDLEVRQAYRHFIFVRPDVWLTYDNVAVNQNARPGTKRFEWRVHPNKSAGVDICKDQIRIKRDEPNSSQLHIQILEPAPASHSVEAAGFVLEENPIYLPSGEKLLNRINASIYVDSRPADWHNFAVMASQDSVDLPLQATLLENDDIQGINLIRKGKNYIFAFTDRIENVSYIFHSEGLTSIHLIAGLQNNTNYSRKITPAPSYGSHYYRIEITPEKDGRFTSSKEGVLYFELERASGVREYPDVSE
jgi:hypothetical protein